MKKNSSSIKFTLLLTIPFVFISFLPASAQLGPIDVPVLGEDDEDENEDESSSGNDGGFFSSVGSDLKDGVTSFGSDVKNGTTSFGSDLKNGATSFGSDVKDHTTSFGSDLTNGATSLGSDLHDGIQSFGSNLKSKTSSFGSSLPGNTTSGKSPLSGSPLLGSDLGSDLTSFGSDVKNKASSTGSDLLDGASSFGSDLKDKATSFGSDVKSKATSAGSDIKDGIISTGSDIKSGVSRFIQKGSQKVTSKVEATADVVGNVSPIPSCLDAKALADNTLTAADAVGGKLASDARALTNPIGMAKDAGYNLKRLGTYGFNMGKGVVTDPGGTKEDLESWSSKALMGNVTSPNTIVKRDPGVASSPSDANVTEQKEAVKQKLNHLSREEENHYRTVRDTVSEDPAAHRELQNLLLNNQLTQTKSSKGSSFLSELHRLSTQETPSSLNQNRLVSSTIREASDPVSIHQLYKATCVATSGMITAAQDNPAEYVRMIRGLASTEGTVELKNGDQISRKELDNYGGSYTQSQRLLSTSLMEYANPGLEYKDDPDSQFVNIGGCEKELYSGLLPWESKRIMEGLHDKEFRVSPMNPLNLDSTRRKIKKYTSKGEPVMAGIQWSSMGHQIAVTDVKNGYVHFDNPHGKAEKMDSDEFFHRMLFTVMPK